MRKKKLEQWRAQLSKELNEQAVKSFQVGLFEQITDGMLSEEAPEVMSALNKLLNCANLLLNHARENMAMINRINHSGMWSMYFGEGSQISRVVFSDDFREITELNESSSNPGLSSISVLLKSIAPSFWIL